MKKTSLILVLVLLLTMLCSCRSTPPAADPAPPTTDPTKATTQPTEPQESAQTQPTDAPESHVVYEGAVVDFMTPVEAHSWERTEDIEFVMLHFTSAVVNNRNDPFNIAAIREIYHFYDVSVHYIIGRDGTVYCYIPEDRVAWHAGEGEYLDDEKYTDKMNLYSIGIELLGIGSEEDMADYLLPEEYAALDPSMIGFTDEQYAALDKLLEDICSRYNIPMDREHILGHSDYAAYSTDPGELLDWSRVLPEN